MKNIYPNELVDNIIAYKYIPRKLSKDEHLKLYHRYWIPELGGIIKVKDIWKENGTEYYIIKSKNDLYICFSYPIDDYYESYELLHDYYDIYKNYIINEDKSYTGAEIKYWFTMHNEKTYDKFYKFINPRNKLCIHDNKKYRVFIDKNNKYHVESAK